MKLKLIDWLYLIPIVGLFIAIIWTIVDINYVERVMSPRVIFYGGLFCHILIIMVGGMIIMATQL